jgi:Baseplate J-like protein
MPPLPPKIDPRTDDDLVKQTATWAEYFTQWRSPQGAVKPDLGWALIRIFNRFMVLLRDRLNQVPDKNFLAFLDLIGTQILPPQPARVPLTFYLAEGSSEDALIPAHTQVAAPPTDDDEVVFETSRKLFVMRSQLKAVIVEEPQRERYSDRTLSTNPFLAFQADQNLDRCLYLACDELFTLPGTKTATLFFDSSEASQLAELPLTWSFWDGTTWQDLTAPTSTSDSTTSPATPVWSVQLSNLPALTPQDIGGHTAGWIRAQLSTRPIAPLTVTQVRASVTINRTDLSPDRCFVNGTAIDLSKDFYPFGEQPRFNDTFYIASRDTFAKAGLVTVKIVLTNGQPVKADGGIAICWETWDGQAWQVAIQESPGMLSPVNLTTDESSSFPLTLPKPALHTINGESNYWIRARIVAGNYGEAALSRKTGDDANGHPIYELVAASFQPPCLKSITFSYSYSSPPIAAQVRRLDRLTYTDFLAAPSQSFQPFLPVSDLRPALYLGFDQPFTHQAIAHTIQLYFQIEPPTAGAIAPSSRPHSPAKLVWEYRTPQGWARLNVEDETRAFSDRGLVRFLAPAKFSSSTEFGRSLYWLRCCLQDGDFRMPPKLRQVLTNTTWANQATRLTDEILGSSQGSPNQKFQLVRSPVLLGEQIEVEEPQSPADLETESWVQWQSVPDFYSSTPSDRHYMLDRLTGTVQFGDGQHGKIPPPGLNNIRAHYYTGGGTQGNLAVETITQLKTTIPFIDHVTNLTAAGGGAAQESLDRVKARGAKSLRHRNRAVTAQDIEDLAFEASTAVVRVRAITPRFDPLELAWQPLYRFQITGAGEIRVQLGALSKASGGRASNLQLEVRINGTGQAIPYQQDVLRSNQEMVYTVTSEQIENGLTHWHVTLINYSVEGIQGSINITFPGGSRTDSELDVPVRLTVPTNQVEVLIVPQSEADQPTPSLTLIDQVETYLRDRALSTLDLVVTEPDWVKVTVTAAIAPVSFDLADTAQAAALSAVTRFLHPLTGGSAGQGWAFGRRPFPSDLYALLESIPSIDHVDSLTIASDPSLERDSAISPLPDDRRDRFLIYSGTHQISLS